MNGVLGSKLTRWTAGLLAALWLSGCAVSLNPTNLRAAVISLPGGAGGIGFDDLGYDPALGKVLIPAGGTGLLDLIDPATLRLLTIPGFSVDTTASGHSAGTTSVTAAHGRLYATDRTALNISVVDPAQGAVLTTTDVITTPDYVRYVAATDELWVTERSLEQIEVFSLTPDAHLPRPTGAISVTNGPEALVIDAARGWAYTNLPKVGLTAVIDLRTRAIVTQWGNGCTKGRGLALDEARGLLFVACGEGKVVVLDVTNDGAPLASQNYGGGLDFVAYNPRLGHLYIPSGKSAVLGIFAVLAAPPTPTPTDTSGAPNVTATPAPAPTGPTSLVVTLVQLGSADTSPSAKCLVADDHDQVWVCAPSRGQILRIQDVFPPVGD